jgi:hypothetical protein
MISRGPSAHQASYDLMCQMLRGVLLAAVQAGPDAPGGIGSVQLRASATLYRLLLDHPVDQSGRCRSCRRPGVLPGRRRHRCRVHIKADYWLHQPDVPLLLSQLVSELGLTATDTAATAPDDTEVLPRIELDPDDPPTQPLQTPDVPSTHRVQAGRPDRDHGRVGDGPGLAVPVHHDLRAAR